MGTGSGGPVVVIPHCVRIRSGRLGPLPQERK